MAGFTCGLILAEFSFLTTLEGRQRFLVTVGLAVKTDDTHINNGSGTAFNEAFNREITFEILFQDRWGWGCVGVSNRMGGEHGVSRSKGGSRSGGELRFTADSRGTIVFSSNGPESVTNGIMTPNYKATIGAFKTMQNREGSMASITGGW